MNETAITLKGVSKRFGKPPLITQALEGVDLSIRKGEFVSLLGPSGCGKTTLLRILAGLDVQSSGEVTIFGESPRQLQQRREIGVAFQRPALEPSRTALQNVVMTLDIAHGRQRGNEAKALELLAHFGLADAGHKYPHELSGGMQQRVNIAAALVHGPPLLFLDEPFGALDSFTRAKMWAWLRRVLAEVPKTVVLVTHSDEEAVMLSGRIVVMTASPGRVFGQMCVDTQRPLTLGINDIRASDEFLHEVKQVREVLNQVVNGGGEE